MKDFNKIYLTGDIHGDVFNLWERLTRNEDEEQITNNDLLFILGDMGFEFYSFYSKNRKLQLKDKETQEKVKSYNIQPTIICIQGNHDVPFKEMHGHRIRKFGANMIESNGIYFCENGEVLSINNKTILVIGGAYSIDKQRRIAKNYPWFKNEELNLDEMKSIYKKVKNKKFDYVLTHTCPYSEMPKENYAKFINQLESNNKTELFLEKVKQKIKYNHWFCGHWHINKELEKTSFVYNNVLNLDNYQTNEKTETEDLIK